MDSKPDTLTRQESRPSDWVDPPPSGPWARLRGGYRRIDGWRRVHPRAFWIVAGVALLALLAITMLPKGAKTATTSVDVHRGDIEDSVTALGTLQPLTYVDVGAQVSGQLKALAVNVGDKVTKGAPLATIDAQVQTAKVAQSTAQLQNLQAQEKQREADLILARQQFERQKNLMKDSATSQDAYDTAKSQFDVATAAVASAQAQVQQASSQLKADQVTLGYSNITAPMDGTVASITAQVGQTLNANQTAPIILRIAALDQMTVWTQVSEADVPKLTIGMPVYFTTLGLPQKRWTGKLRQIMPTPTVTNNVVLYTALFDVDNTAGDLMTQMTAQVFFVRAEAKNVLLVPVAALHAPKGKKDKPPPTAEQRAQWQAQNKGKDSQRAQRRAVTVVKAGGRHEERIVTVGVTNRVTAEIRSGLQDGEKVLVNQKDPSQMKRPQGQNGGSGGGNRQSGGLPGGPGGFR